MSIELQGISKSYGDSQVLFNISAELKSGTMTALVGPSGSGKSTLLRIIAGLEPHGNGNVLIEGRDVTNVPVRRRNIGFCFQDYAPFRHMTVANNVAYGLHVRKVRKAEIQTQVGDMLERVGLESFAKRYPHELSGGQRQRMALARSLIIKPEVLLLDEPFAALDAQVRADLRLWVRGLQRELGITTILVTHDQSEAMEVADQLVVLHSGQIQQMGTPQEIYDAPANQFVQNFLGPITTFEGAALRPHALQINREGRGTAATIRDVIRLGFEVRVIAELADGTTLWVQMTHDEAFVMSLEVGEKVCVTTRASS